MTWSTGVCSLLEWTLLLAPLVSHFNIAVLGRMADGIDGCDDTLPPGLSVLGRQDDILRY